MGAQAQFKLALMRAIDRALKSRYDTLSTAAEAFDLNADRLSRLRHGRHQDFSIKWLFQLADLAEIQIRIRIDPLTH